MTTPRSGIIAVVAVALVMFGPRGSIGKEYVWDRGAVNSNNWNDAANWSNKTDNVNDSGFPNGAGDVALQPFGPAYMGTGLMLNQDITAGKVLLNSGYGDNITINPGTPGGKLKFDNNGSQARLEYCRGTYPGDPNAQLKLLVASSVVLSDDLFVYVSSARTTSSFTGPIVDDAGESHTLTLQVLGASTINPGWLTLSTTNTYKGGTVIANSGPYGKVIAAVNGALGAGDVTVQAGGILQLNNIGTNDDMIANTASLYMISTGGVYGKLILTNGVNESVSRLYLNGAVQPAGTYGSTNVSTAATYKLENWFEGSVTGILTVLHGSASPSMILSIR